MKRLFVSLFVVALLLVSVNVVNAGHVIPAWQIAQEYDNNEVEADLYYYDRDITVGGYIIDIGLDLFGYPYVILGDVNDTYGSVQCSFKKKYKEDIAKLQKNKYIAITGEVGKKIVYVQMSKCKLM